MTNLIETLIEATKLNRTVVFANCEVMECMMVRVQKGTRVNKYTDRKFAISHELLRDEKLGEIILCERIQKALRRE